MCSSKMAFVELNPANQALEVSLGDGHRLDVVGEGVVSLKTRLSDGRVRTCKLLDVLYVPALAYNLVQPRTE